MWQKIKTVSKPDWRMFYCGNCILKINLSNQKSWISWISWNFFCKLIFCNQIMKEIIYFLVTRYFGHFKMGEGGNLTEIYFYLDNYVYQKYIVYDLDSILCDRSCCILALLYIITYTFLLRLIILFLLSAFALVFYIFIKCHSLTYCWKGFFFCIPLCSNLPLFMYKDGQVQCTSADGVQKVC